jgi:hypothetical protein
MAGSFNRDELGRFSIASAENGGGANFPSPVEQPATRDALLKNATSQPTKAPSITGGSPEIAYPDFSDDAFNQVMKGHTGLDIAGGAHHAADNIAHRAMGYGNGEGAGGAADNLSERFTPHAPVYTPPQPENDSFGQAGTDLVGGAPDAI